MSMLDFVYFEQTFCQPFLGEETFVEEVCLARNILNWAWWVKHKL